MLGWSGMRGGVSLAAAFALPLTAEGHAFPDRSNVIFIAYIVIAATLVIPGLTLSPLIRRLGLAEEEAVAREEARARVALARAALEATSRKWPSERSSRKHSRTCSGSRTSSGSTAWSRQLDGGAAGGDEAAIAQRLRELRRELIAVERRRLADLRRRGEISAESSGGSSMNSI